jgi:alkylhydroperoxidase/carboxymuconolactone decarboxylase family protein YurZ
MSNTTPAEHRRKRRQGGALALAFGLGLTITSSCAATNAQEPQDMPPAQTAASSASETLTLRQQAIVSIAALAAAGDIANLNAAVNQGLDAGLTVSDAKEVLVQLYAYAGFPRSLNALAELMKVLESRKQRNIQNAPGHALSRVIPKGEALLAAGTANQTKLSGGPVKGPLFDFAPAIDEYLKTHLFGDIFERDNLDWPSRELATVGMLSALPGTESQLQAHMRIGMNVGLTAPQLRQLTQVLAGHVDTEAARRAREALERHLSAISGEQRP